MNIEEYWQDIDLRLEKLLNAGEVKLPSIKHFDLEMAANKISNEMGASTFKKLSRSHKEFLDFFSLDKFLTPKLFKIAREVYNFKGDLYNQYHIARKVSPGNAKERYRAHFDSHLFTMVIPLRIPEPVKEGTTGDLIYFPNARKFPKNEMSNLISKIYYKKNASEKGIKKFAINSKMKIDNFRDYQPLLFIGNTTLHTNHPVSFSCSSYRLTLLAHFFDPSTKYGAGSIMRILRNR